MTLRTDDATKVGRHTFEISGCGHAPFKLVGVTEQRGTCKHCGAVLAICCEIEDAEGHIFDVGTGCVRRTGDAGLLRAFKNNPQQRALVRAKTGARNDKVRTELRARIDADAVALRARPHPWIKNQTMLDYVNYRFSACGAAGKKRMLAEMK